MANALRDTLSNFILEKCTSTIGAQDYDLNDLHAMMILHAYSRPSPNSPAIPQAIPAPLLKALVEGYAINIGLHRSVEAVKLALKSHTVEIATMPEFKKYTYWLWMYTLAHQ